MADFKLQRIDTPAVMEKVAKLFEGQPLMIAGFAPFLPPGYEN